MIDTQDFRFPDEESKQFAARVLGPDSSENGGYLTAMKAKYRALGVGVCLLKEAQRRAVKEDRELTPAEWDEITAASYGVEPPIVGDMSIEEVKKSQRQFVFDKIEIRGDRALATVKSGRIIIT